MKINILSSNFRSKTGMGVHAQDRSGDVPHGCLILPRRARRAQLGRCTAVGGGNSNNQRVEAEDEKSRGGTSDPKGC